MLKKFPREKFSAKKIERATPGVETRFIPHITIPPRIARAVKRSGSFGRDLIVKRRWVAHLIDGFFVLFDLALHRIEGSLRIVQLHLPVLCALVVFTE